MTQQLSPSPIRYRRDGSDTGRDFSMTACMSVKIAVVPPIPSASVSTAVAAKTRAERNVRRAYVMSRIRALMGVLDGRTCRLVGWAGRTSMHWGTAEDVGGARLNW